MLPAGSYGVHAMETVDSLREKALQCWQLIHLTTDERASQALRTLAEELEAAAEAAEAKVDPHGLLAQITEALKPTV